MKILDTATLEENVALALRFVEDILGGQNLAAFSELVDENIVVDSGLKPFGKITGRSEYREILGEVFGTAFANPQLTIKDITALVDGRVVVNFEAQADNVGALNGIAATGKRFTFCELHLMRFENGKLVENTVGGLNPLMFEIWQAPKTAERLLADNNVE